MDLAGFDQAIRATYPKEWGLGHMSLDDLLAHWWTFSQLSEDDIEAASKAVTRPKDGGVDAVWIDDDRRTVTLVQAKFRDKLNHLEKETDFDHLTKWDGHFGLVDADFQSKLGGLSTVTRNLLTAAREKTQKGYELGFHFVSTGRISAGALARQSPAFVFIGGKRLLSLYDDYAAGVQPVPLAAFPVAASNAEINDGSGVQLAVYLVGGDSVRDLARTHKSRIFARNIRGFLGESSPVNAAIVSTIQNEPARFRYMNNGLTMVCDRSVVALEGGRRQLSVYSPQIVNGQQTSRSLARVTKAESARVDVLVKVVTIDRDKVSEDDYDRLVREIVEATNRQSSIAVADLRSNDKRQVDLYRAIGRLGFYYARKTASHGEYQLKAGGRPIVTRPLMADAVANCLEESLAHRQTKETLYHDPYYEAIFDPLLAERNLISWYLWRHVLARTKRADVGLTRDQGKWLTVFEAWRRVWADLEPRAREVVEVLKGAAAGSDPLVTLDELVDAVAGAVEGYFPAAAKARGLTGEPVKLFKVKGLSPELATFLTTTRGETHERRISRRVREFVDATK